MEVCWCLDVCFFVGKRVGGRVLKKLRKFEGIEQESIVIE